MPRIKVKIGDLELSPVTKSLVSFEVNNYLNALPFCTFTLELKIGSDERRDFLAEVEKAVLRDTVLKLAITLPNSGDNISVFDGILASVQNCSESYNRFNCVGWSSYYYNKVARSAFVTDDGTWSSFDSSAASNLTYLGANKNNEFVYKLNGRTTQTNPVKLSTLAKNDGFFVRANTVFTGSYFDYLRRVADTNGCFVFEDNVFVDLNKTSDKIITVARCDESFKNNTAGKTATFQLNYGFLEAKLKRSIEDVPEDCVIDFSNILWPQNPVDDKGQKIDNGSRDFKSDEEKKEGEDNKGSGGEEEKKELLALPGSVSYMSMIDANANMEKIKEKVTSPNALKTLSKNLAKYKKLNYVTGYVKFYVDINKLPTIPLDYPLGRLVQFGGNLNGKSSVFGPFNLSGVELKFDPDDPILKGKEVLTIKMSFMGSKADESFEEFLYG